MWSDSLAFLVISENPSFHISRALSDYAPGRQIILNQYCYTSGGIQLKSRWNDQTMARVSRCTNGHTTLSILSQQNCHCGANLMPIHPGTATNYTIAIEPAGFCVDYNKEPTRVIDNDEFSIVDTELINTSEWEGGRNTFRVESRSSIDDSEIMYYNNGVGFGYAICIHCGRALKENGIAQVGDNIMNPHPRLRGGRNDNPQNNAGCSGNDPNHYGIRRNVLLIGRFQTDFIELRFSNQEGYIHDIEVIRSLGVILAQELAHHLGINESEISYGIKHYQGYKTIYLFDTAKGGAGYASQFISFAKEIFDSARVRLQACTCTKACTKCLVNRSSKWHLDELDRLKALEWLVAEFESRTEVPEQIRAISPNANRVTRDIISELHNWIDRRNTEELVFFINCNANEWNIEEWKLLKEVKEQKYVHNKQVKFVLLGRLNEDRTTNLEIIRLKSWSSVYAMNNPVNIISPLAIIKFVENQNITVKNFFSLEENNSFDENWGIEEAIFTDTRNINIDITEFNPVLHDNDNTQMIYVKQQRTSSKNVAQIFVNEIKHEKPDFWSRIENAFNGKEVTMSYSDRYVLSKFNSMLLLQFISEFAGILNLNIEHLQLNFTRIKNQYNPNFCTKKIYK